MPQLITSTLLSLIIPGSGFMLLGRFKRALLWQVALWLAVAITCWGRWVLTPAGITGLLLGIAALHLGATIDTGIYGWRNKTLRPRGQWLKRGLLSGVFMIITLAASLAGFMGKPHWLGIQINFIPSHSMYPTLHTGDFVLVDSWAFQKHTATQGDIVVFRHDGKFLIKRVSHANPSCPGSCDYQLLGDNLAASIDSRSFGAVQHSQLQGQAKVILFSINGHGRWQQVRWLKPL